MIFSKTIGFLVPSQLTTNGVDNCSNKFSTLQSDPNFRISFGKLFGENY